MRYLLSTHLESLYLCLKGLSDRRIERLIDIDEPQRAGHNQSIECLHALDGVF